MSSMDEGLEKSAMLLLALGSDEAAEVLKLLGPKEVQKLGMAMASLPSQQRSRVEAVLDELEAHRIKGAPVEADEEQIRAMLTKALGDERAGHIIARVLQGSDTAGINCRPPVLARSAYYIGSRFGVTVMPKSRREQRQRSQSPARHGVFP